MTTRIRDQQILNYVLNTTPVFATEDRLRPIIADIIARHAQGIRLSSDEIDDIKMARKPRASSAGGSGTIAVLPLWGVLAPHGGVMVDMSTEAVGLDEWRQQFNTLANDPDVAKIVLRINSPGGSAGGVTEAARTIREGRAKKPVIAVADGMAASAAFCLATQADEFYVTPSGMVGAVHTYSLHADLSARLEQAGVKITLIGEPDGGAAETTEFQPLSEENLAHAQAMVKQFYDTFVSDVAKGRGVSASTVEANYGRGRVLTANDALAAGMVDGIVSFDDVLTRLSSGKALPGARQELDEPGVRQQDGFAVAVADASAGAAGGASFAIAVGAGGGGGSAQFGGAGGTATVTGSGGAGGTTQTGAGTSETVITKTFDQPSAASQTATQTAEPATADPAVNEERSTTMSQAVSDGGRPATFEELAAQKTRITDRLTELNDQAAGRMFNDEEKAEFNALNEQHDTLVATMNELKARNARMAALASNSPSLLGGDATLVADVDSTGSITILGDARRGLPDNLFDLQAYRRFGAGSQLGQKMAEGAKFVNEKLNYATNKPERTRAFVEQLLAAEASSDQKDGAGRDGWATRFLITADPAYERQFAQWFRTGRDSDLPKMAVSIGGLGSETPVPITIDPTVLLVDDGAVSPLRRISRVVTITGNTWRGITSDGLVFNYDGELDPITPQTPTFDAPEATVQRATGEVQLSLEVDGDWPDIRNQLVRMLTKAKNVKEADIFLHGTGPGTKQPTGLVYAIDIDDSSVVSTASANALAIGDIRDLPLQLPPTFEEGAQWIASKAFYSKANALSRAESNYDIWVRIAQGFQAPADGTLAYDLLGYPTNSASEMSTLFTTGGENVAIVGNFGEGFQIIDRVGMNVEFDPHPRDSNGKWTGARALLAYFRNTTLLLTPNAFRMLQIKAT